MGGPQSVAGLVAALVLCCWVSAAAGGTWNVNWSGNASYPVSLLVQVNDTVVFSCPDDAAGETRRWARDVLLLFFFFLCARRLKSRQV
jgi:hypothetical protein